MKEVDFIETGIEIIRFEEHIKFPGVEKNDTLLLMSEELFKKMKLKIQELKKNDEFVKELQKKIIKGVDIVLQIIVSLKEYIKYWCSMNKENQQSTILGFYSKFRGFYLTILHLMTELLALRLNKVNLKRIATEMERSKILFTFAKILDSQEQNTLKELYKGKNEDDEQELPPKLFFFNPSIEKDVINHFTKGLDFSSAYRYIGYQFEQPARLFYKYYLSLTSGCYSTSNYSKKLGYFPMLGSSIKYFLFPKLSAKTNLEFSRSKKYKEIGAAPLNAVCDPVLGYFLELSFPSCKMSKEIGFEVPETFQKEKEPLKQEEIKIEVSEETGEIEKTKEIEATAKNENSKDEMIHIKEEVVEHTFKKVVVPNRSPFNGSIPIDDFWKFHKSIMNHKLQKKKINIRINSSVDLDLTSFGNIKHETYTLTFGLKKIFTRKKKEKCSSIVIFIHGGGFVACNSQSFEGVTRKISNDLNCPVFSIDYSLAPEKRYPEQPLECYLGYKFIIENAEKMLKTKITKIVLMGDSAGGNLATSTIYLAIANKIRLPDCVGLFYPCQFINYEGNPSKLNSLTDPFLSKQFFEVCFNSYPNEDYEFKGLDPFLSTLTAPDEIFQQFPRSYVVCCSLDPLFDDGVSFCKRLALLKKPTKLIVLDAFPHAFLNMTSFFPKAEGELNKFLKWVKNEN